MDRFEKFAGTFIAAVAFAWQASLPIVGLIWRISIALFDKAMRFFFVMGPWERVFVLIFIVVPIFGLIRLMLFGYEEKVYGPLPRERLITFAYCNGHPGESVYVSKTVKYEFMEKKEADEACLRQFNTSSYRWQTQ